MMSHPGPPALGTCRVVVTVSAAAEVSDCPGYGGPDGGVDLVLVFIWPVCPGEDRDREPAADLAAAVAGLTHGSRVATGEPAG
jgi:hypothetical protein